MNAAIITTIYWYLRSIAHIGAWRWDGETFAQIVIGAASLTVATVLIIKARKDFK